MVMNTDEFNESVAWLYKDGLNMRRFSILIRINPVETLSTSRSRSMTISTHFIAIFWDKTSWTWPRNTVPSFPAPSTSNGAGGLNETNHRL